ncbi:MAG: toxin YoeB [Betaproteobacteria bacterium RIFCSPLOWO2_12_FULL_67_28]|nr:MAG: toxin YoeB [Betaproteobacteria bacterium RIFCSPLOWO2_12_FULL_67_28]
MRIVWAPGAWRDYLYWSRSDVRVRDKINTLIEDIQRHPFTGLGKPEPLKRKLRGFWSRRISREHRLVYRIESGVVQIAQCRFHY